MVDVVITTWDDGSGKRFQYLDTVLSGWARRCGVGRRIIIADDGSDNQTALERVAKMHRHELDIEIVTGPHGGIGTSLNRALAIVRDNWVYTTDDWMLAGSLDMYIGVGLRLLDMYDVVRLGPVHPNLECTTRFQQGIGWWLEIETGHGGYPFGTRPFLAKPNLINQIGRCPDNVDSYVFETAFNERCVNLGLSVAAVGLHGPWEHIGEYEVGDRPVLPFTNVKGGAS